MSASINVAGPVEIVRERDLLAAAVTKRHRSSESFSGRLRPISEAIVPD
jgi:hypothetical protein